MHLELPSLRNPTQINVSEQYSPSRDNYQAQRENSVLHSSTDDGHAQRTHIQDEGAEDADRDEEDEEEERYEQAFEVE